MLILEKLKFSEFFCE